MRAGYTLIEMLTTVALLIILLGLSVSLARYVRERAAVALTKDVLRRLDQLMEQYAERHDGHLPPVAAFPRWMGERAAGGAGDPFNAPPPGAQRLAPQSPVNELSPATRPAAGAVKSAGAGAETGLAHLEARAEQDAISAGAGATTHPASGERWGTVSSEPPVGAEIADRRPLLEAALANNHDFVRALKLDTGLTGGALRDMPSSMYDEVTLRDAWGSPIVFMPSKHPWVGTAPQDRFFFFSAGPDRLFLKQDDNLYSYENVGVR